MFLVQDFINASRLGINNISLRCRLVSSVIQKKERKKNIHDGSFTLLREPSNERSIDHEE